ncbi:MAG: hypothetical protein JWO19_961 [Bryobacterales bacterium]|nr:hypothetical protein [Bryobacterales bacterium]
MKKLVRSQTAKRLKKLDAEANRVARKPKDADAIHDLRVSVRRLNQELRVFQAWFEAGRTKPIRRRLRKLMKRCAAVRNCDVAIEVLKAAGCDSPERVAGLEKERRAAREELASKLEGWRLTDKVRKWREHLRVGWSGAGAESRDNAKGKAAKESVEENARRLLPAMTEDLFRSGHEAARPDSSHRKMHQFRLKAKRVRYTLEIFEPVYGSKTDQIMESLKGLQEKLGAINDCATTIEMIRRDRDAAEAVRRLAGEREAEFRSYWKQRFGPPERLRWKAVLGAADGKN